MIKAINFKVIDYSRSSRKRQPKMQRLSGRLQESDYEGSLPRRRSDTSILWKITELHAMSKLRHVCM